jgi:hypothetical protein
MPLANASNLKMWTDTIIMLLNDTQLRSEYAHEGKTRIAVFDRNKISAEWLELIGQTR